MSPLRQAPEMSPPATLRESGHSRPRRFGAIASTLAASLLGAVAPSRAHDFWIQPQDYAPPPSTDVSLTLRVGHAGTWQRSELPLRRVTRFAAVDAEGRSIDLRPQLRPGGADDGRFELPAGRYQLLLETDSGALSRLPAARFNRHLESEGLVPALEHRRRKGRLQADGSERYGRVSKAIVRVGTEPAGAGAPMAWPVQPVGHGLELVLEQDPLATPAPERLPVRVFHRGAPLAGPLVKLAPLDAGTPALQAQRTGDDGRATFPMPAGGTWLLTVAWIRVLPPGSETDYETTFSSLSFSLAERAAPR